MTGSSLALRAAAVSAVLGLTSWVGAAVIAYDGFGDGDRNNDGTPEGLVQNASDTGMAWYTARGTSSIAFSVPTDDGSPGIGFGNAMNVNTSTTSNRPVVAMFSSVTLADGDSISLSMSYRAPGTITTADRKFRVGLYNSLGTVVPGDTSTTSFTNDDVGYFAQLDTGPGDANVLSIFGNTAGTLLGGTSQAIGATSTNAAYAISDNTPHTMVLTLTRQGADLAADLQIDSLPVVSGITNAAGGSAPLTFTYDEIALGVNGVALEYRIDNVSVSYNPVPEPSALMLGVLGFGLIRRRSARVTRCD